MSPGSPAHTEKDEGLGGCSLFCIVLSSIVVFLTLPISLIFTLKIVQEYERAVIFRLGRVITGGARGPGLFFVFPCTDDFIKVDLRTFSMDIAPQEILTKDSVTVAVDAVVFARVFDPVMATCNVAHGNRSTNLLAATTLRNILGTKSLSELLSNRDEIADQIQGLLDEYTDPWGIQVERVEIKDVRLPVQLQRAMAAEAEATRQANSKVIAAKGEQNASKALKEAADILTESESAIQLRFLQTIGTIAAEKDSTIMFPIPLDLSLDVKPSQAMVTQF